MYHCGTTPVLASLSHFLLSPVSVLHWVGFPQGHQWPPSWPGQCLLFCVHLTWSVSSYCFCLPLMFFPSLLKRSLKCLKVWSRDLSCAHSIHSPQVISAGTKLSLVPGCRWPPDLGLLLTFHYSPWPLPASCPPPPSDHSLLHVCFFLTLFSL